MKSTTASKLLLVSSALLLSSTLASKVVAASDVQPQKVQERQANWEEKKADLQQKYQERISQLCEKVEERVQSRIDRFEANKDYHLERYNHIKGKLRDIVSSLKAKGYDTSNLETHLVEFDGLVQTYAQEYAAFIDLLEETLGYACGESEGAFREALHAAREQLKVAREARRGVWQYYKDVIRKDIMELREQAEVMAEEAST